MTTVSGRSPSGRATRASTEPASSLGHSASVPNAVEAVRQFIAERTNTVVKVDNVTSHDWKSLTFTGQRWHARFWVDDTASAVWPILRDALPDAEFSIPGEVMADVEVRVAPEDVPTWGGCTFVVEALTVEDDPAGPQDDAQGEPA